MSELTQDFNPEGVVHGPHKPAELTNCIADPEFTIDAKKADKEAHDTVMSARSAVSDTVSLAEVVSPVDAYVAGADLHRASYQNEMNGVAIDRAHKAGLISRENARAGKRNLRTSEHEPTHRYWDKVTDIAGAEAPKDVERLRAA